MFTHFNHRSIRNLVIAFGSLFNNIIIERNLSDGSAKERIRVPIAYGAKEKFIQRWEQGGKIRNEEGKIVAITLPRMSFLITSIDYDPSRKRQTIQKISPRTIGDEDSTKDFSYSEVPYNIGFELNIMVRYMEDGLQIVEQILPYFTPEFNITINATDIYRQVDIPIVYQSTQMSDDFEGSFEDKRVLTFTINFVAKSYIYGRVFNKEIIRQQISTLFSGDGAVSQSEVGISGGTDNFTIDTEIRKFGGNTGDIDLFGELIE